MLFVFLWKQKKMKRISLLVLAALSIIASSCDKNLSYYRVDLKLYAQTADGTDLLNPAYENNILDDISIMYDGKEYICSAAGKGPKTKACDNSPYFDGLVLGGKAMDGKYWLRFGNLDGLKDYDDVTFIVKWSDTESDEFVYSRRFRKILGIPNIKESITINGEKNNNLSILKILPDIQG